MKKFSLLSMMVSVLALGACDHYSTKLALLEGGTQYNYNDVASIAPAAGGDGGMTFSNYLTNEYIQLANYENDVKKDYKAAQYYTNKIEALDQGQMVSPATFKDFSVERSHQAELQNARAELISAMHIYNIPENRYNLARAQSSFDCWMDQTEDNPKAKTASVCEVEFKQSMSSLILPDDYFSDEIYDDMLFDLSS